jgi:hypothetical protein
MTLMKRLLAVLVLAGLVVASVPALGLQSDQADAATCLGKSGQQVTGSGSHHKKSSACK